MAGADAGDETAAKPDVLATVRLVARRAWPFAVVLAVVLTLLGWLFRNTAGWGDVPTWVLAATTLLAFIAAAFGGLVAYELLKIESCRDQKAAEEREQRRDAERRSQAGKVAAWYGLWRSEAVSPGGTHSSSQTWPHWGALISNASDLPVFNVRITYHVAVNPERRGVEWDAAERHVSPDTIPVIPPGVEKSGIPDHVRQAEEADGNEPRWLVAVSFTDADGRRWCRGPHGTLSAER